MLYFLKEQRRITFFFSKLRLCTERKRGLGCQNLVANRPFQTGHWFAMIEELSEELGDAFMIFLHSKGKSGSHAFSQSKADTCWVPRVNILSLLKTQTYRELGEFVIASSLMFKMEDAEQHFASLQK